MSTVLSFNSDGVLLPNAESELILPRGPRLNYTAAATGLSSRGDGEVVLGDEVRVRIHDCPVD